MRRISFRRLALFGLGATLVAVGSMAHMRLKHSTNGNLLFWSNPGNISIVSSSVGSDNISDGSCETALRNAIDAWNDAAGSTGYLAENTSAAAQARTDWQSYDLHQIWFDEDGSSGYFPGSSSIVAITPIWFYSDGRIADADVIFNGKNHNFTTKGAANRFDIQDVATHELGHLLGLDHSGWAGASMYPYVSSSVILHRSLGLDDVHGMRAAYPSGSFASISGTVRRTADSSPVAGAHVVVRDSQGRTAGAALAGSTGAFTLRGLDAGQYDLYAAPLEGPMSAANLGAGWTVQTDFELSDHGSLTLAAGESRSIGNVFVASDVTISLGQNNDRYPLRCPSSQTSVHLARGTGLSPGSTLSASDPTLVVTPSTWSNSLVSFSVTVPGGAAPGHVDLIATNPSGDRSVLVAGLEITPPDPTVALVSPNQADLAGGTLVTITGTNFNPGCRVVVGSEIYEDGAVSGCTWVDSTTITLTTQSSQPGISDVVVIDSSGVEGRKSAAFQVVATPQLTLVFPAVGSMSGWTRVVLSGQNFVDGVVVRIDGVVQAGVSVPSTQKIEFWTSPSSTGLKVIEVENPGGFTATSQFSFVAAADPNIVQVTPASGTAKGGDGVTLTGTNFTAQTEVVFAADQNTGQGGVLAGNITFIDSSTLSFTTPAVGAGMSTLMVRNPGTGQIDLLSSGFNFQAEDTGGGGGGCASIVPSQPPAARDILGTLLWFAALAFLVRGPKRIALAPIRAKDR